MADGSEDGALRVDRLSAGSAEAEVSRLQSEQHSAPMGIVRLPYDRPTRLRRRSALHQQILRRNRQAECKPTEE